MQPLDPRPRASHRPRLLPTLFAGAALTLAALAQSPTPGLTGELPDTSHWPHPSSPSGNRYHRSTASALDLGRRDAIAQLGKALFWDEQVSADNSMACGTCHDIKAGGTDIRHGAVHPNTNFGTFGVIAQADVGTIDYGFVANPTTQVDRLVTPVNAPTMIGAYLFRELFWDLRAGPDFLDDFGNQIPNFLVDAALEDLAVGPPVNEVEMGHENMSWTSGFLQQKLNTSYPLALVDPSTIPPDVAWITGSGHRYDKIFDKVFHWHPQFGGFVGVTRERFAMAIAHYHRTLIPDRAPIDLGLMSAAQVAGFNLIRTRGACFSCHSATGNPQLGVQGTVNPWDNLFSDGRAHDIFLPGQPPRKTPTLRNLGLHQKFFSTGHGSDGISNVFVTNFSELIDFYNQQPGGFGFFPPLSAGEKARVIDFLQNALTDPRVAAETAPFDRPKLYSEANPFGSNLYGSGTGGPSGFVPQMIANAPPKVPGAGAVDWFKLGVGSAPPAEPAWLHLGAATWPGPVVFIDLIFATLFAGTTTNEGFATVQQPVPLIPAMLGIPFFAQWKIADGTGSCLSEAAVVVPF
ncbi:MAG: hypothetical protein KF830_08365 [Planctomycetes bacterium]|nr:hypothetical protein [Planctomycetota bacterium]